MRQQTWVWPWGILPKTQKRSNAPRAGHAFATNPLLSPWVALGLPGGRPLGMAADTRISAMLIEHRPPLTLCQKLLTVFSYILKAKYIFEIGH